MIKKYDFILQGEDIDGNFISKELYIIYPNIDLDEALKKAKEEAKSILESLEGGHIDIMDLNTDKFYADVEV